MDITTTTTLINSTSTVVYAVIAFFTLQHFTKDSREQRRPHVVVYGGDHITIAASYSKVDGLLLGTLAEGEDASSSPANDIFPIMLSNAGGGAALSIQMEWTCDGLEIGKLLLELLQQYDIKAENHPDGWMRIGTNLFSVVYESEQIPFVSGSGTNDAIQRVPLPSGIQRRLELLLAVRDLGQFFQEVRKVYVNVQCKFADRSGRQYFTRYRFRVAPVEGKARQSNKTVRIKFLSDDAYEAP